MHRFHLPPELCRGERFHLSPGDARHAAQVLRLGVGDPVTVLDGAGGEIRCAIEAVSRREVSVRVRERIVHPTPGSELTLVQSLAKAGTMDTVLQKATELGAARIVPVMAERSVSRVTPADAEAKAAGWQATVIEAAKQCGAVWLPKVVAPRTLKIWLTSHESVELLLVASLADGAAHPRTHMEAFVATHRRLPRSVAICVGPEGDFTPDEIAALLAAGAKPITLGPLVLRVDTAAAYCLAVLGYELSAPR